MIENKLLFNKILRGYLKTNKLSNKLTNFMKVDNF